MNALLSLALGVPLVCLAFVSLLGFVGIMALAGVMHVIVTAKTALLGTGATYSMPKSSWQLAQSLVRRSRHIGRRQPDEVPTIGETHRYVAIENSMRSVESKATKRP